MRRQYITITPLIIIVVIVAGHIFNFNRGLLLLFRDALNATLGLLRFEHILNDFSVRWVRSCLLYYLAQGTPRTPLKLNLFELYVMFFYLIWICRLDHEMNII